jgi:drug/metabolite transporter (DMT)-like permease
MVSIKLSIQGVPPLMAATARSAVAAFSLWIYALVVKEAVFLRGKEIWHGSAIGVLFGVEFVFFYWGLAFTDASRAVIFLYTAPFFTALGAHFFLADDRLTVPKIAGLCLAFTGVAAVLGSRSAVLGPDHWIGDAMEVGAGALWAATSIYIKRFILGKPITHFQTLFAQIFFSIPVIGLTALLWELRATIRLSPLIVGCLAYQSIIVAFASYLAWFWMIHRYPVVRLSAFTFLTPLFGVIFSSLILGEELTPPLWAGLALVATGIYLVNRPDGKPVKG